MRLEAICVQGRMKSQSTWDEFLILRVTRANSVPAYMGCCSAHVTSRKEVIHFIEDQFFSIAFVLAICLFGLMSVLLFPSVLFLDPANLTGKQTPLISYFPMSNRAFYFLINFFHKSRSM